MFKKKRCQFEGTSLVFRTICFHFKNEKRGNSKLNIPSQTNCSIRYPITTEDMPWGRYKLLICRELMSDELLIKSNNYLFIYFFIILLLLFIYHPALYCLTELWSCSTDVFYQEQNSMKAALSHQKVLSYYHFFSVLLSVDLFLKLNSCC